jgi:hypothetical protein
MNVTINYKKNSQCKNITKHPKFFNKHVLTSRQPLVNVKPRINDFLFPRY